MKKKEVRIVSVDPRYRKEPYPAIPIYNERLGTYITGQHIDPSDPETLNNLTKREIEQEDKLSADKRKKFPHVIVAEMRVPIQHLRIINLSTNDEGAYIAPKDVAELEFFKLQEVVAPSKGKVINKKHWFYIEDKEAEAETRVANRTLQFEAEKLVRENLSISMYQDVALVLNYKIQDFSLDIRNSTDTVIQDALFEACRKNPADVIKCFDKSADMDKFILKLEHYGIINLEDGKFYDGGQYLGDTVDDVKKFLKGQEGSRYHKRWSTLIAQKENTIIKDNSHDEKAAFDKAIRDCSMAVIQGGVTAARDAYERAFLLNPEAPELVKLDEAICKLENPAPYNKETDEVLEPIKSEELKMSDEAFDPAGVRRALRKRDP